MNDKPEFLREIELVFRDDQDVTARVAVVCTQEIARRVMDAVLAEYQRTNPPPMVDERGVVYDVERYGQTAEKDT